jgi:hypothetical protein
MDGKSKIGEDPLRVFKIFHCYFDFSEISTEMWRFREKGWKCHVLANSR